MNPLRRIRSPRLPGLVALAILLALGGWFVVARLASSARPHSPLLTSRIPAEQGLEDDPNAQLEMEFLMLRDPMTNTIPVDIHRREVAFARRLPRAEALRLLRAQNPDAVQDLVWTERGPNNVGGRTRAFAIDVANATTLLAGGVGGGMWKSTDDGASWTSRMAPSQMHSTTCVAQDRRSGKTNIWYSGTGEIRGSTTNDTRWGSLYRGDGIFKSTDNGDSWTLLASTASGTPQTSDNFDWVIDVATDPSNLAQDEVYAATSNGVYRSTDGGTSWTQSLAADSSITDVAVTSTGVVYAFTHTSGAVRIWRSPDGTTWTNILPAGFPTAVNRVVMGLAPSNVNVVYFFCQGVNTSPQVAGHQLWKYVYVSGNGSGAGGTWTNRGGTLPSDLNTQTGYDMNVHVKPNDENFVIIGGTNLYRSTDGFASTLNTTTIGGYPYYPDLNHHPDQHSGGFSPVNANVFYSSNDGGVAKAPDVTMAGTMVWTSLDHGYNVTQLYSVSIAPEAASNMILAGAQDNGSWLGNAPGASDWTMAFGGDGTVVKVAPIGDDRLYTQYQGGQMQRQNRDGSNLFDITPAGAANQLFVNPIVLDPNNSALLYYAGGVSTTTSRIWRNDNAPNATNSTGWSNLATTEVGAGSGYVRRITAIGISTAANPNVLYYGTVDGLAFRADNANTATPTVTNITVPGLAGGNAWGGFVRCIAVDPTDSNKALLTFGNYNFPSLWYTTNGGASWTDVEGNLAGASGPSVRFASMFYVDGQLQVFLATSVGVFSTTALAGGATVWAQEGATSMGNIICGYLDYRASDRTLAVGTHSRGVFTTVVPLVAGVGDRPLAHERMLAPGYPNPARGAATIAYRLPSADQVSLRAYDVAGREVATLVDGRQDAGPHQATFARGGLASGTYLVVLRTNGRTESAKLTLMR